MTSGGINQIATRTPHQENRLPLLPLPLRLLWLLLLTYTGNIALPAGWLMMIASPVAARSPPGPPCRAPCRRSAGMAAASGCGTCPGRRNTSAAAQIAPWLTEMGNGRIRSQRAKHKYRIRIRCKTIIRPDSIIPQKRCQFDIHIIINSARFSAHAAHS